MKSVVPLLLCESLRSWPIEYGVWDSVVTFHPHAHYPWAKRAYHSEDECWNLSSEKYQGAEHTGLSSQSFPYSSMCRWRSWITGTRCPIPRLSCPLTRVNRRPAILVEYMWRCPYHQLRRAHGFRKLGKRLTIVAPLATSIVNSRFRASQSGSLPAAQIVRNTQDYWMEIYSQRGAPTNSLFAIRHTICNEASFAQILVQSYHRNQTAFVGDWGNPSSQSLTTCQRNIFIKGLYYLITDLRKQYSKTFGELVPNDGNMILI